MFTVYWSQTVVRSTPGSNIQIQIPVNEEIQNCSDHQYVQVCACGKSITRQTFKRMTITATVNTAINGSMEKINYFL